MFSLAIAIQALLPDRIRSLTIEEPLLDGNRGIVAEAEKGPEFFEEGMIRIAISGEPSSSGKGPLDLVMRAD